MKFIRLIRRGNKQIIKKNKKITIIDKYKKRSLLFGL